MQRIEKDSPRGHKHITAVRGGAVFGCPAQAYPRRCTNSHRDLAVVQTHAVECDIAGGCQDVQEHVALCCVGVLCCVTVAQKIVCCQVVGYIVEGWQGNGVVVWVIACRCKATYFLSKSI